MLLYNFLMKYFVSNIKNNIDFFLRNKLVFSRKNYFEKNEDKDGLFPDKNSIQREKFLLEKYNLDYLKSHSTVQNYLENLYTIDLLDKYLEITPKDNLSVLDVGCKNWFYAKGEYFFFNKYCEKLSLNGIELDPNRVYTNLYSRAEVAKFHLKDLQGVNYIKKDFLAYKLEHNEKYDFIIWILPFVAYEPLQKWGLPKKYFQPKEMLAHAYDSLKEGGELFIINQGEAEYEEQKKLCDELNILYSQVGEVDSFFINYKINRYALLIKKLNK